MEIVEMKISNYEDIFKLWTSTPGMGLGDLWDGRKERI